jgi:hypothetical protein
VGSDHASHWRRQGFVFGCSLADGFGNRHPFPVKIKRAAQTDGTPSRYDWAATGLPALGTFGHHDESAECPTRVEADMMTATEFGLPASIDPADLPDGLFGKIPV